MYAGSPVVVPGEQRSHAEGRRKQALRPLSVTWAARLMVLGAVVSFAGLVALLYSPDRAAGPWAMILSIEAALWLVMAHRIAAGHIVARFLGTVLAVLNVLFTIGMFDGAAQGPEAAGPVAALSLGNAVLGSAIVGMLWTPTADPYFD